MDLKSSQTMAEPGGGSQPARKALASLRIHEKHLAIFASGTRLELIIFLVLANNN